MALEQDLEFVGREVGVGFVEAGQVGKSAEKDVCWWWGRGLRDVAVAAGF